MEVGCFGRMHGGLYGRAMYVGCTLVRTNLCDYLRKKRACVRFVCTIDAYGPLRTDVRKRSLSLPLCIPIFLGLMFSLPLWNSVSLRSFCMQ